MLTIELQFPAGRYHATPWGRNVNEGDVEWPPSPYRLARALVDVWMRKKPDWSKERVEPILKAISTAPLFNLPLASAAHTRSFLSSNQRDPTKKQLIFDSFVALKPREKVSIGLDGDLAPESVNDLEALLRGLNYFGRSESWVRAKVGNGLSEAEWNCVPMRSESPDESGETVEVACLLPPEEYDQLPNRPEASWLDAVCLTTKELLAEGWSNPPALRWVNYVRNESALRPLPGRRHPPLRSKFRCAKFALQSTVLPRVQETVPFAERIRSHLMGIHKRIQDNDPTLVSKLFSGKDRDGGYLKEHRHAFYLPVDEDGDGRLDHIIVYARDPFNNSELATIDRLRSVWQPNRRPDVNLVLVSLSAEIPGQRSKRWVSATPFVTSRHYRKGRGTFKEWLTGEVYKECGFHGLPEPVKVQWIPHTSATVHPIRWMEFIRSRKSTPPFRGQGCILDFEEPVSGPFALGSGCHFGLGLFVPYVEM